MLCKLCKRETKPENILCIYHNEAHRSLMEGYEKWKYAFGDLPWRSYLERLIAQPETGAWIREMAELELTGKIEVQK